MDENTFRIQTDQIARMAERFPAHPLAPVTGHPQASLDWLAAGPEFGRHAWDEGGHL